MAQLIAKVALKYPKPVKIGEAFTVDDRNAKILILAGKAVRAGDEGAETESGTRRKRSYKRRDLLAEV